ncbi:hypothetical protein [Streptomyces nigrescens]|uniref:hypothetical protein n=1 Tax=Streptomyces nigrescens TaxID=1920 RepID=UPI0037F900E9
MANPNKAKGTSWETSTTHYLNDRLGLYKPNWKDLPAAQRFVDFLSPLNVKRQAQTGAKDVGDLWAWPFVIECKDVKSAAIPAWLRQAKAETENAGFPYGVVVHKTRSANAGRAAVHFDVRTWTRTRLQLGLPAREFWYLHGFTCTARGLDTSTWRFTTDLEQFALILRNVRNASR